MEFRLIFNRLYNNRRNAVEVRPVIWEYQLTTGMDGIGVIERAGPVANQLCNIAEGLLDWFRTELDLPELTFHDVSPAVEEDNEGNPHFMGDLTFAVHIPGEQDALVELPEVVADMVISDVMVAQTIIITRHTGSIVWLKKQGIDGNVIPHFDGNVERGATYIGVLPILMIFKIIKGGGRFFLLSLPKIAFSERGKEMSPEEMTTAGATLHEIFQIKMEEITNDGEK